MRGVLSIRIALALSVLGASTTRLQPQASTPAAGGDSVSIRFVDTDLRVVVQALAQYLDLPIVISAIPPSRVTLEAASPVARRAVLPLLRGLLASQGLTLALDSSASLMRVEARQPPSAPETSTVTHAATPTDVRAGVQLYSIRLRHARASDVSATVNALYGRASAIGELGARRAPLPEQLQANVVASGPTPDLVERRSASQPRASASFSGDVTIVPDHGSNTLMVRASERDYELIKDAVTFLDVRPLQVLIEVTIAEIRRDRGFTFGVSTSVDQARVSSTGNTTVGGSTTGVGLGDFALTVMNVGGVDLNATLRAAAQRGDVSILSRPVLLAANNERAQILVGSQRPFVQVSRSLPTDSPQRDQVVQYKDVGTQLQVRPTISGDGYVMLEVTQEVNAVTTETAFDAPVISTRSVQTRLLVRDGQAAVLGGLADRQRDASQGGVPILSAIPIVGGLFGRVSRRTTETELFVFLTPRVLYDDSDVDEASGRLKTRPEVTP